MTSPTPEQMLALNAMLQQTQQDFQQAVSVPVTIQNASIGVDPNALTRSVVLEGTAVAVGQGLDQLLMKTSAGEVLMKVQQLQDQELLNLLPSRVTLQLRPGPDGLQAILVVGTKPIIPDKPVDSLSAGTALASRQTLAAEIPRISQIHQALILPSSLFSSQTPEQFLASLTAQAQAKNNLATPQQGLIGGLLEKLGFSVPSQNAATAAALYSPQKNPGLAPAALPNLPQPTALKILGVATPEEALKNRALAIVPGEEGAEIAIVRGNTPSGQPVLSVGDKLVAIQGGKNWPVGTQLKISMGPQAGLVIGAGEPADFQPWAGLSEAMAAIAGQSPAAAADIARMRLPQPAAAQLPGALLFLLNAMQAGAPAWLGDEFMQRLKGMNREELIKKIEDQWRKQMNQQCEGPGGEWRGMSIPLFDHEKMQVLRFYIYNPPDSHRKKRKDDPNWARRFLIDMSLSRLGPVQFDGLVHKQRLDLVVRTERALPEDLRADLAKHFARTMEEVRYTGNLLFAANRMGWVEIKDKPGEHILRKA